MYLITAYFDEKTNRIMQRYIDDIARITGNTFMTVNKVPPHMTISSIEARSEEVLIPSFEKLRGNLKQGRINFVSVGQFLPYVMFVTPVLNQYLSELSEQIYDTFKDLDETEISRFYRPKAWLPHATLAKKLDKNQMRGAFEYLQDNFSPFEATVESLGLSKVNPHKDISVIITNLID